MFMVNKAEIALTFDPRTCVTFQMALRIEANPISGSCIVEKLHADGSIASRQSFRNATASICRNALKDVMVRDNALTLTRDHVVVFR